MPTVKLFFIFFLIALCVALGILYPNLQGEFSVIDETSYERPLALTHLFKEIETNIESDISIRRYRPVYHIIQSMNQVIFRDNVALWYVERISIAALCIALASLILSYYCNYVLAFIFSAFIFFRWYWGDVWCRLGPQEGYATMGLVIYCWSLQKQAHGLGVNREKLKNSCMQSLILIFGFILAIYTKESFIFLSLIALLATIYFYRHKRWGSFFTSCITLLLSFHVMFNIKAVLSGGYDVYSNSVDLGTLLLLLGGIFGYDYHLGIWKYIVILSLLAYIIFFMTSLKSHYQFLYKQIKNILLFGIILLLVYASQYLIYNGDYPSGFGRYNIPGMLSAELYFLALFIVAMPILEKSRFKYLSKYSLYAMILILFIGFFRNANVVHVAGVNNVRKTSEFQIFISKLTQIINDEKDILVVFESQYSPILETELIYSTSSILSYRVGYDVPNAIRYHKLRYPFNNLLEDNILNAQRQSSQKKGLLKKYENNCISVFFYFEHLKDISKLKTNCLYKASYKL